MGLVLLTRKDTDAWEGRDLLASEEVIRSRAVRRQGKEGRRRARGRCKPTATKPQALTSVGEGPVTLAAPTCPSPAHLLQSLCKWLISFDVRWGPQSSLSRNWHSWVSKSLGGVCRGGWTRESEAGGG